MYRSLVNGLPTLGVFAVIMGVTTLFAVLVALAVSALKPTLGKGHYPTASTAIKGTFALLFGLIFALAITDVSAKGSAAASTSASEAATLAQMVRSAGNLPVEIRVPVRRSIREYTRAVVEDEWKTMANGQPSVRASTALDNMYATYQSYVGKPAPTAAIISSGLSKLDQIVSGRRTRLDLSRQSLPGLLRVLLIVGVIMFIVLSIPSDIENRRLRVTVTGGIAAFLAFSFALTVVLDYPFSGGQAVSNGIYRQGVLAQFFVPSAPPPLPETLNVVKPSTKDLVGEWTSAVSKNGVIIFREVNGEIRAAYRADNGTFVGQVDDQGVLRGWWCEEPTRKVPQDAGEVEWRLLKTRSGQRPTMDGRWRYGVTGDFTTGWSLQKVATTEPVDLAAAFDDASRFCPHPGLVAEASPPAVPATTTTTVRTTKTTTARPITTTTKR